MKTFLLSLVVVAAVVGPTVNAYGVAPFLVVLAVLWQIVAAIVALWLVLTIAVVLLGVAVVAGIALLELILE